MYRVLYPSHVFQFTELKISLCTNLAMEIEYCDLGVYTSSSVCVIIEKSVKFKLGCINTSRHSKI